MIKSCHLIEYYSNGYHILLMCKPSWWMTSSFAIRQRNNKTCPGYLEHAPTWKFNKKISKVSKLWILFYICIWISWEIGLSLYFKALGMFSTRGQSGRQHATPAGQGHDTFLRLSWSETLTVCQKDMYRRLCKQTHALYVRKNVGTCPGSWWGHSYRILIMVPTEWILWKCQSYDEPFSYENSCSILAIHPCIHIYSSGEER